MAGGMAGIGGTGAPTAAPGARYSQRGTPSPQVTALDGLGGGAGSADDADDDDDGGSVDS